ncbi:cytochrome b/b6 domain-containing protein [Flavobacterium frigoris]|uniref:Cytochrome b561 n=1 Tax=Flavobacterium frigoris TaxID=229204 RepID=A0A1H9IVF4_FLAFI|nr:cytochrome b/b6 domain-containing protein [Flavobacterium frigoris]SEQ78488.1 cytochrome b561 [Flavobacterium frigoris]
MENRNYTVAYRIIHWAIAICMMLILFTIFLRSTWMNKNSVADIIRNYLATTDQSLSDDQMISLAKQIRKPMWDWHIYIGYVLVGFFSIRMLLPFLNLMKFSNPLRKGLTIKEKFQYWIYLFFYGCVAISLVTGLIIEFGPKNLKGQMEEIHVLSIYYLLAFIFIHLSGVFVAEFTTNRGLISKIISGKKKDKF